MKAIVFLAILGLSFSTHLRTIANDAHKVDHFVSKHKDTIEEGAKTVNDLTNSNYGGATVDGIHTLSNIIPKQQMRICPQQVVIV